MEKPTPPKDMGTTQPVELDTIDTQPPPAYEPSTSSAAKGPPGSFSPVLQPPLEQPPHAGIAPLGDVAGHVPQNDLACVPLETLQVRSAPVHCPNCGRNTHTIATAEAGRFLHGVAAFVCIVSCLGCIPYLITSLKDVHHKCGNCGISLARFHHNGRTEVLAFINK